MKPRHELTAEGAPWLDELITEQVRNGRHAVVARCPHRRPGRTDACGSTVAGRFDTPIGAVVYLERRGVTGLSKFTDSAHHPGRKAPARRRLVAWVAAGEPWYVVANCPDGGDTMVALIRDQPQSLRCNRCAIEVGITTAERCAKPPPSVLTTRCFGCGGEVSITPEALLAATGSVIAATAVG